MSFNRLLSLWLLMTVMAHAHEEYCYPQSTLELIDCLNNANHDEEDNIIDLHNETFILSEVLPPISDCDHKLIIKNGRILRSRENGILNFRLLHIKENAELTLDCVVLENGSAIPNFTPTFVFASQRRSNPVVVPIFPGLLRYARKDENIIITQNQTCGGAILNEGKLKIENSVITANEAQFGGGICNVGYISHINKSTISSNDATQAHGQGGGIYNEGYIDKLSNMALYDNAASFGGGSIYNRGNIEKIINSTFSSSRDPFAGGIYNFGFITQISNNTIVHNANAGLFNNGTIDKLISNILANNDTDLFAEVGSVIKNATHNFVEAHNTIGVLDNNNIVGFDITLHPLADNGGLTATHALLPGSPAINNGANPDNLLFDQRGSPYEREVDNQIDIGSYEFQLGFNRP